jgi:hypothetical protein
LRLPLNYHSFLRALALSFLFAVVLSSLSPAQQAPQKPPEKSNAKASTPTESQNPAQIELLETRYRFEANGDSRKEVHARVHINSELGVRQFARLNFDYNRSFQSVDIPLVHITHPSGGTADILPSAITDQPNPAVISAPVYQDVRVKSVRILGLEPGDNLEYRVITTTTHHPLAPDFWLDHSFDRTGVVSREIFELDLPALPKVQIRINPNTPADSHEKSGDGNSARSIYRWAREITNPSAGPLAQTKAPQDTEPDVALSTEGWDELSVRLDEQLMPGAKLLEKISSYEESMQELSRKRKVDPEIATRALELAKPIESNKGRLEAIYDFVSQKITTIDLPLGATGFAARAANEVLATGYATPEDKFVLFSALASALQLHVGVALTGYCDTGGVPRPSVFKHLLVSVSDGYSNLWLDPSLEVAPFGMISPIPEKCVFVLNRAFFVMNSTGHEWQPLDRRLPFAARQRVDVDASLTSDGKLAAKVHYALRGENELLLRIGFHQTPKDKWKDLAQLLSLSDGFRGQVTSVNASDPYATREPFTVDYEITQPKFVDWSRKPLRIPALLPQLGLPDPPAKPAPGAATAPIELGTPLEVETRMTLHLPPSTTATAPTGTSVQRDYATFSSQYAAPTQYTRKGLTVTASRHLNFLLRQVPAERAADYNAFLRAVLNDQAQDFTLDRESAPAAAPKAAPSEASPPTSPKP